MLCRLFLLAALLPGCSGASSVEDPVEHVRVFAGDAVLLPCSFSIPASGELQTVEWSKHGLDRNIVFLHRGGYEIPEEKHPDFLNRTSIIPKELENGNFSLRISNVRLADAGTYRCMRMWMDGPRNVTSVELVVAAVSEPKLWVTSAEGGNVTLRCEASCWLPELQIDFLDKQGKYIQAEGPKRDEDARGCFTVTRRVTLQAAAANGVTCRVHQPETNQTRETEIIIPVDGGWSCILTSAIAVGATVSLLLVVCLGKRCGKCAEGQKLPVSRQPSDQSTFSGSSENQLLLPCVTIEDLRIKLREQENTILQLQSQNQTPLSPVVCQHDRQVVLQNDRQVVLQNDRQVVLQNDQAVVLQNDQAVVLQNDQAVVLQNDRQVVLQNDQPVLLHGPAVDSCPPKSVDVRQKNTPKPGVKRQSSVPSPKPPVYRFRRNHSSPDIFKFLSSSSAVSASKKKLSSIGRSKSETYESPLLFPKPQRRHSSVFPSSNNRFKLLADVTEEPS